MAEKASWRWIFWFLAILSGLCLTTIVTCLPETSRKIVGNGSIPGRGINRTILSCLRRIPNTSADESEVPKPIFRIPNPFTCLRIVFHKDTALILFANAIFYMNYSCMQASLPPLLMHIYGLNALQVGLTYLAYGIGCGAASYLAGKDLHLGPLSFFLLPKSILSFHFNYLTITILFLFYNLFPPTNSRCLKRLDI